FDHLKVGIAVVVQRMVESEKSGVMFSIDPVNNDSSKIVIEGGLGLGEAVVSGAITPDRYVVDKSSLIISEKQVNEQDRMIIKVGAENKWVEIDEDKRSSQKLNETEILALARYGREIEEHYGSPQDMEWAIEGDRVYIVQSRAVTTMKKVEAERRQLGVSINPINSSNAGGEKMQNNEASKPTLFAPPQSNALQSSPLAKLASVSADNAKVLLQGRGASPGIASGVVRLVSDLKELYKVKQGDIMVTQMTTPDFVPAMKRAAGIVTDEGGSTCHAAIVSRELGIPCIVGTRKATAMLEEGESVTVDAVHGVVYAGKVELQSPKQTEQAAAKAISAALGGGSGKIVTGTKIYVNVAEPELAEKIANENVDGIGLLRAEFMIAGIGKHPKWLLKEGRGGEFVDAIAKSLRKACAAFGNRPVIYRATDFKTNEYKNLEGGAEFEPHEENPMIGFRGCFRYMKDPEVFNLELEAIKRVREQYGMKNLWLMIPMVRTVREFKIVKQLVEEAGLHKSYDFKLGIMCEVPSTVILIEEFCKEGVDFVSIGSNDLTQLTLGIDRNNSIVAEEFDERDEAVIRSMDKVIRTCRKYGVKSSICGQAPSVHEEITEMLVRAGIDAISVNVDVIEKTRALVAQVERKILLEQTRV
ncbi:MAG: phosphoenolpyruvate synthase, partial [Candidatus Micrarchaeota archaeon]